MIHGSDLVAGTGTIIWGVLFLVQNFEAKRPELRVVWVAMGPCETFILRTIFHTTTIKLAPLSKLINDPYITVYRSSYLRTSNPLNLLDHRSTVIRECLRSTNSEEGCLNPTANDASCSPTTTEMSANFLSLPRELRDQIYAYVLVDQDYIDIGIGYYPRPFSPPLLRTNKTIHREATSLLYTHNRFNFTGCDPALVPSFFDKIGRENAKHIRHIRINFPKFLYLDPGDVTLDDESNRILEKIQSCCANLSTLTTSVNSTNALERKLDNLDCPKIGAEALKLVDTRFKAISSLQKIIVEVCKDGPSDHIRRKMESHGWTISTIEYVEEYDCDNSSSDFEYHFDSDYSWP